MIRALLTDLDGVIRLWDGDADRHTEHICGLPSGALHQAAFAPELLVPAITGQVTDETWRQQVTARLASLVPTAAAAKAVQLWSASAGTIDLALLALVRRCRQQVPVVLVTNATSRLPADLDRLGLLAEFDHIINSSVVGYHKPHPTIYQAALAAAGVTASEAFFLDDSAANVTAASTLGLVGYLYRTPAALQATLHKHGLLGSESIV
ncbi:MAG: HAD-IA family hydrolase [Caldilineaceae bacterium]|nr:HAD-IA family hydrolase [Caldilineaceae bacterium]